MGVDNLVECLRSLGDSEELESSAAGSLANVLLFQVGTKEAELEVVVLVSA